MKLNLDRYVPGLLLWLSNKMASSASSLYRTHFDLGKAAVSRSVALLQERGFLKSRPLGLRKIEYATTPAGKKQHDRIIRMATAQEEALLTGFSDEERTALIGYMHRMLANLEAVRKVGREPH